jgi:hypothetical protein
MRDSVYNRICNSFGFRRDGIEDCLQFHYYEDRARRISRSS